MAKCILLVSAYLAVSSCIADAHNMYIGTEDSLRSSIVDLFQGKFDFSDDKLPHHEGELLDVTPENDSEYDFIVIGAGSAGATIASRLSEAKDVTVLLIEAGIEEYPIMDIPYIAIALPFNDKINWKYETESSNKFCLALTDSKCQWPRAKVMGGNSVFNYMIATRGNPKDYDGWANATGDESWSYKEMLKYFKKLEDFNAEEVVVDDEFHNKGGPLSITSPSYRTKLGQAFIDAHKELGIPEKDYNGEKLMGASFYQRTIANGERWSVNRAYLHPVKNRTNLFLTRNSHVNKILIDEVTKRAYGVQFTKNNRIIEVEAKKEIILSAGAINSPQILMLSGIGPAKHLRDLDIPVVKDAAVGENLMDHLAYSGLLFKVNDSNTFSDYNILDPANPAIKDYLKERKGLLTSGPVEAISYVDVSKKSLSSDNPNIELLFGAIKGITDPGFTKLLGISDNYLEKILNMKFNHSTYVIWPMIMQPNSLGRLLLRSKNPNDRPKLYPNYLDHPEDVKIFIKGIRAAIKLTKTKAFQKYGSELYELPLPCNNFEYDSDSFWECALRNFAISIFHQSGTCKMGVKNDTSAVVDSALRVIGIEGLRVADASIMPKIVSAHPNIPIVAIGEKISDQIKKDWSLLQ